MPSTKSCILAGLALAAAAATAPALAGNALEEGRDLTTALLEGRLDTLEPRLSAQFLEAIGDSEGLAKLIAQIEQQAGAEQEVLAEHVFTEGGMTSYYRISRFAMIPSVTTRWVWNEEGTIMGSSVRPTSEAASTDKLDYQTKARLRLPMGPVEDGFWYVAWGGRDPIHNYHTQAPDQRFAYDFVAVKNGIYYTNGGERNEDHFCWGQPMLAPAAGTVVRAVDGIADNARPGVKAEGVSPPGNHVVIDHGNGEFSFIAHLRNGSVTATQGREIRSGDKVGECGNSGRSDLPHLHYHLQNSAEFKEGAGLPAPFLGYFNGGRLIAEGEPLRGDLLNP